LKINLYNNIVLAGGSTLLPGFYERFDYEIKNLAMHSTKTDINVSADLHRKYAAWIGGSMMASFSTFQDMAIKREDYEGATDLERSSLVLKKTVY
jgi:actin-related protein